MTIYRYRYLVMLEMTVIYTREKRETLYKKIVNMFLFVLNLTVEVLLEGTRYAWILSPYLFLSKYTVLDPSCLYL